MKRIARERERETTWERKMRKERERKRLKEWNTSNELKLELNAKEEKNKISISVSIFQVYQYQFHFFYNNNIVRSEQIKIVCIRINTALFFHSFFNSNWFFFVEQLSAWVLSSYPMRQFNKWQLGFFSTFHSFSVVFFFSLFSSSFLPCCSVRITNNFVWLFLLFCDCEWLLSFHTRAHTFNQFV